MNGDFPSPPPQDDVEIIAPKNKGGRPPHQPTDAFRNIVTVLAGIKWSQKRISACLKIDDETLVKHYREELDNGEAMLFADVVGKLMEKIRKGDTRAILYFLEKMNVLDPAGAQKALETPRNIRITVVKAKEDGNTPGKS